MVFVGRVQIHVVTSVSKMLAAENDIARSIVVMNGGLLPFQTPGGFHRLWNHTKIGNRPIAQAESNQTSAAQEGEPAVIKQITIQVTDADPCGTGAHKPV